MGTVYKAWDKELERTVALKLVRHDLTYDPHIFQRFKQELLLASRISHRNVLRIQDLGDGPGDTKFISMAYIDGQDLSRLPSPGSVMLDTSACRRESALATGRVFISKNYGPSDRLGFTTPDRTRFCGLLRQNLQYSSRLHKL